jgi:serine protease Do
MLGVTVQQVTPTLARSLRLDTVGGALVSSVAPDGAAANAGVKRGDVITAINGLKLSDSNALRNHIAALGPNAKVTLTVVREGRERTLTATLEELPSKMAEATPADEGPDRSGVGLAVQPLTPETARRFGIDATRGLLVTNVDPSGPAADAGLQRGDVIQEVEGKEVQSVAELRRELSRASDRPALMLVRRGESSLYMTLDPRES